MTIENTPDSKQAPEDEREVPLAEHQAEEESQERSHSQHCGQQDTEASDGVKQDPSQDSHLSQEDAVQRDGGGGEAEGATAPAPEAAPVTLPSLLEACADSQLLSSLASLLGVLPRDSQARCLAAVREALAREAEEALKEDAAGEALWRRLLAPQVQTA
eukprot:CAMPEP_0179091386 /NCGR_PEP_ID=MMETSP0796-20121207/41744_1 /TAXON_ID=73915 /ORGANISM="Pyrodinium bahamense, Strain pbaha01" /LENGTH=158 /DNA_ID=CAMNT_0020788977 /DNA_START=56 /DNA_END=528 /DNA_ORIENTATION=-